MYDFLLTLLLMLFMLVNIYNIQQQVHYMLHEKMLLFKILMLFLMIIHLLLIHYYFIKQINLIHFIKLNHPQYPLLHTFLM